MIRQERKSLASRVWARGTAALAEGAQLMVGIVPETGPMNRGVFTTSGSSVKQLGPFFFEQAPRTGAFPEFPRLVDPSKIQVVTGYKDPGGFFFGQAPTKQAITQPLSTIPGFKGTSPISWLTPGIATFMSGYFIYKGYQGEMGPNSGWSGAMDMAVQDLAANIAIAGNLYPKEKALSTKGAVGKITRGRTLLDSHLLKFGTVSIGAYTGASIGQHVMGGGPLGAFAGAAIGARIMRSPISALASTAIIGGGYVVGKGTYQLLKRGYRRSQEAKGLDTAGETSAFMTRGAVTMRARAMEAIHKSHLNARSALGQEATLMHMARKDYFSTYRR